MAFPGEDGADELDDHDVTAARSIRKSLMAGMNAGVDSALSKHKSDRAAHDATLRQKANQVGEPRCRMHGFELVRIPRVTRSNISGKDSSTGLCAQLVRMPIQ